VSAPAPPRGAVRLLRRSIGVGRDAEAIVGDLIEEYAAMRRSRPRLHCDLWFRWQAARISLSYTAPVRSFTSRRLNDLRLAMARLRKDRGFTVAVIATLSLSIGAGSAIFSVVDGVLLRPLPFAEPDRLVRVWAARPATGDRRLDLVYSDLPAVRDGVPAFSAVSMYSVAARTLSDARREDPEEITVARASVDLFATLGVSTALGRPFTAAEAAGDAALVVISHGLWQRRFGGVADAIGRRVHLDTRAFEIVGVLEEGRSFPPDTDVWRALSPAGTEDDDREARLLARLAPAASLGLANEQLAAVAGSLAQARPESHGGLTAWAQPLQLMVVADVRLALYALLGAVGLVLLLACVNTANLLIARSARRAHDVAVHTTLGASRGRIVWLHLSESILLAAVGGAAGLLVGRELLSFMLSISPQIPRLDAVTLDGRVATVMMAVSGLAGVLFGVGPALYAASTSPARTLRAGTRSYTVGKGRQRAQSMLVTTEIGLSTALVLLGLLLLATFRSALHHERGFETENLVTLAVAPLHPPESREAMRVLLHDVRAEVARIDGIESTAWASHGVMEPRGFRVPVRVAGGTAAAPAPHAFVNVVSNDFFETAHIALVAGESFSPTGSIGASAELIINERFRREHLVRVTDPIGVRLDLDWITGTVVGVVADVRPSATQPALAKVYVSLERETPVGMSLVYRTSSDPTTTARDVRTAVTSVTPDALLQALTVVDEEIRASIAPQRFNMLLAGVFATLALALAAVGVYAMTSLSVANRRTEIGVRRALGAPQRRIVAAVVARVGTLTVVGVAWGVVGAAAVGRLLTGLLIGVAPTEPWVVASVATILGTVALVASAVPVARALRIHPRDALTD